MTLADLQAEVEDLIDAYEHRRVDLTQEKKELSRGKLYELFVLGKTLEELTARGFSISLQGAVLDLKQGPGAIQPNEAHFVATKGAAQFKVYTDIEVTTIGAEISCTNGLCSYHEIDIIVVDAAAAGRPSYLDLALGVECKSNGKFKKGILKEVLGVKREISFFRGNPQPSKLASATGASLPEVNSEPALEFWLAHADPAGSNYASSPGVFGIEFKNWQP
jgi:hypothetical protein